MNKFLVYTTILAFLSLNAPSCHDARIGYQTISTALDKFIAAKKPSSFDSTIVKSLIKNLDLNTSPLRINIKIANACFTHPEEFNNAYKEVHSRCTQVISSLKAFGVPGDDYMRIFIKAHYLLHEIYTQGGWGIERDYNAADIILNEPIDFKALHAEPLPIEL